MNARSEKMSALFQELKLSDGRRIDACKTMLLDWLIAEKQMLQTQQKVRAGFFLSFFVLSLCRGSWVFSIFLNLGRFLCVVIFCLSFCCFFLVFFVL